MKIYKKEKIEKDVYVKTICDKCGKEFRGHGLYNAFQFDMKITYGDSYPEGGSGEEHAMDLCEECSIKFIELLKENNYNIDKNEWEW